MTTGQIWNLRILAVGFNIFHTLLGVLVSNEADHLNPKQLIALNFVALKEACKSASDIWLHIQTDLWRTQKGYSYYKFCIFHP